jgi:hypothetical protein
VANDPTILEETCAAINRAADALEGINETLFGMKEMLERLTFSVGHDEEGLALRVSDIGG